MKLSPPKGRREAIFSTRNLAFKGEEVIFSTWNLAFPGRERRNWMYIERSSIKHYFLLHLERLRNCADLSCTNKKFFPPWNGYNEDFCFIPSMGWTPLVKGCLGVLETVYITNSYCVLNQSCINHSRRKPFRIIHTPTHLTSQLFI